VNDLKPLKNMLDLKTLDISNTEVRSVRHLSALERLETLHMFHTRVFDLAPLTGLRRLGSFKVGPLRPYISPRADSQTDPGSPSQSCILA